MRENLLWFFGGVNFTFAFIFTLWGVASPAIICLFAGGICVHGATAGSHL